MKKTKKRTVGQRFHDEITAFCDLYGFTIADICRESDTERSVITRWGYGETNPTMVLAHRVREAMEFLKSSKQ